MCSSPCEVTKSVAQVAGFVIVSGFMTYVGMFVVAASRHGATWYSFVGCVLAFLILMMEVLFQKLFHEQYLSPTQANCIFLSGFVAQLAYYFVFAAIAKWCFARLQSSLK